MKSFLRFALAGLITCSFFALDVAAQCRSLGPICSLSTTRGPAQRCVTPPQLCSPLPVLFRLEVYGAPTGAPALLVLSSAPILPPPIPIPRPLACDIGCALEYLPLSVVPLTTDAAGIAGLDVALPCANWAVGLSTYSWWAIAAPTGCVKFSDVMQVTWM